MTASSLLLMAYLGPKASLGSWAKHSSSNNGSAHVDGGGIRASQDRPNPKSSWRTNTALLTLTIYDIVTSVDVDLAVFVRHDDGRRWAMINAIDARKGKSTPVQDVLRTEFRITRSGFLEHIRTSLVFFSGGLNRAALPRTGRPPSAGVFFDVLSSELVPQHTMSSPRSISISPYLSTMMMEMAGSVSPFGPLM